MSQCPLCHASVADDFGLIECSGCGAQLIVHMDGRVEYQGVKDIPVSDGVADADAGAAEDDEPQLEGLGFPQSEPVFVLDEEGRPPEVDRISASEETQMRNAADFVPPGTAGGGYAMPEDDVFGEAPPPVPVADLEVQNDGGHIFEIEPEGEADAPAEEVAALDPPAGEEPAAENLFFEDADGAGEPPPAVYNSGPSNSPDLSDVANFGNSDISGGRDGSLRYNLFIEGIDTSDVREAFREALTDRKLMWDIDQILRTIRNGRVSIPNVGPTKAYILISRLRGMPVQVRWEQYAISQT